MSQGPEPSLAELLAEARAATAEAVAELSQENAALQQEVREERAARDAAVQQFAERARSGELGPDQRRMQERFDLGESSWDAVLSGADPSPDAEAVRATVDDNARAFAAAMDQVMEEERLAGRPDTRAEGLASFEELRTLARGAIAEHGGRNPRGQ